MSPRSPTIGPVLVQPSPFATGADDGTSGAGDTAAVPADVFGTFDYLTHALGRSLPQSITAAKAASARLAGIVS